MVGMSNLLHRTSVHSRNINGATFILNYNTFMYANGIQLAFKHFHIYMQISSTLRTQRRFVPGKFNSSLSPLCDHHSMLFVERY